MEPLRPTGRQAGMSTARSARRLVLAVAFGIALTAAPVADVVACTCAGGRVAAQVESASLAFIGTVVDHRESEIVSEIEGRLVEYAFRVERATAETPEITLVSVSGSETSCGVTFSQAEQWLVVLPPRADLGDTISDTHLCAGNTPTELLQPHEIGALDALLTVAPSPAPPDGNLVNLPVLVYASAAFLVLLLLGIGFVAFRRRVGAG
jgi:hypothetical protein